MNRQFMAIWFLGIGSDNPNSSPSTPAKQARTLCFALSQGTSKYAIALQVMNDMCYGFILNWPASIKKLHHNIVIKSLCHGWETTSETDGHPQTLALQDSNLAVGLGGRVAMTWKLGRTSSRLGHTFDKHGITWKTFRWPNIQCPLKHSKNYYDNAKYPASHSATSGATNLPRGTLADWQAFL